MLTAQRRALSGLVGGLLLWLGSMAAWGAEPAKPQGDDPYPFDLLLSVLERDLTSPEYRAVVDTMIPTDLAAEWKRVATPDNYEAFLAKHGGPEKVQADPALKAAYARRKKVADAFLELMRKEYVKRKLKPPFDTGETIDWLNTSKTPATLAAELTIPVQVVMPAPGSERQWPRFRGPTGQGAALEPEFPLRWSETENVVWKTTLPGVGNSSPVIWDDRIFITRATEEGQERVLACYSRTDGSRLWEHAAPAPSATEKLYWKNSHASATPVTDGDRVLALFGNSGLVCCDMSGQRLWHQPLTAFDTTHGPGSSPLLYKDKVIVVQDQNKADSIFAAFDKTTGKPLWNKTRPKSVNWSTPVVLRVADHDELIINGTTRITAYDPETGAELWFANGSSIETIPTIVVGGGLIFSTSGRNGPTLAILPGGNGDVTATHVHWQVVRGGPHVPSPAYHARRLYLLNDTGIVTCLDALSGKSVWQKRLGGKFTASVVEAGGKLLLVNESGVTYVLRAGDQYELMATNDLKEDVLATPAVLGGRIYVRTKQQLLCIGE